MGRLEPDRGFEERPGAPLRPLPAGLPEKYPPTSVGRAGGDAYPDQQPSPNQYRQPERVHRSRLDATAIKALVDVGTFRALTLSDLARYHYQGNAGQALQAMNQLVRQGLIEYRTTRPGPITYVALTPQGRRSVENLGAGSHPHQQFYDGFVPSREARHDAALYRLYQQQSLQIAARNGRVTRIVLELEFKRSIGYRLSGIGHLTKSEQLERKQEIAQEHGLKIVNGKIPIPDLRLEYEGPNHEPGKVDLELVTENYHRGNLALKAQAGFAMYALPEDAAHLRSAMQDPEIMQDILSL